MSQTDEPTFTDGATVDVVPATTPVGTAPTSSRGGHDDARKIAPRIELDACLRPGRVDARRLLVTWFVKKSFWWMFFGGFALASVVHFVERVDGELEVSYRSPEWALFVLAVLVRVAIPWIALALAFPLARAHEYGLEPRTGWSRQFATLSDRYKVAKAFRGLRWTHHVRQVALERVSPGPGWWRRLDPMLDAANVIGVAVFVVTTASLAAVSVA